MLTNMSDDEQRGGFAALLFWQSSISPHSPRESGVVNEEDVRSEAMRSPLSWRARCLFAHLPDDVIDGRIQLVEYRRRVLKHPSLDPTA
jgi:hypothetical protein